MYRYTQVKNKNSSRFIWFLYQFSIRRFHFVYAYICVAPVFVATEFMIIVALLIFSCVFGVAGEKVVKRPFLV